MTDFVVTYLVGTTTKFARLTTPDRDLTAKILAERIEDGLYPAVWIQRGSIVAVERETND